MAASRVALLGTLRELHTMLPQYGLGALQRLVADKKPDLLCVEIDKQDWEAGDLGKAPLEDREALVQIAESSEITLIPVGSGGHLWVDDGIPAPSGGFLAAARQRLCALLDRFTVRLMKLAGGPRAINSPIVEHLCGFACDLQLVLTDSEARKNWEAKNCRLLDGVLWALQHDPGRRVLVAIDCRRKHWLRRKLQHTSQVTLVDFWRF